MTVSSDIRDAWRLTRPGQWPILTAQFFLAVMLVSPRAAGGGCWLNPTAVAVLGCAWLAWVVLLNGGTLAFNSAHDRDTGPVAYLPHPPQPPVWLGPVAVVFMAAGAGLGWVVVGHAFGLVLGGCVLLSVLYSHPAVRLKARPGWDLATNMIGYGAATTLAGILAGLAAYLGQDAGACAVSGTAGFTLPAEGLPGFSGPLGDQFASALSGGKGWLVAGFGLLFGSFYPTTQIYQVEEDLARGDRTLVTALDTKRSLALAVVLGVLTGGSFFMAWMGRGMHGSVLLPMIGVAIWTAHLGRWWIQADSMETGDHEKGMYTALFLWAVVDVTLLAGWFLSV